MIHLYYGEGKGKTTAAVGLAVRMAGHGKNVFFAQFMKSGFTGELEVLKGVSSIYIGRPRGEYGFYSTLSDEDKESLTREHNQILSLILERMREGKIDLLVLDEITYAYHYGLADKRKIRRVLAMSDGIEAVCTGRRPADLFFQYADYVTEMKKIRHPYDEGVAGRAGVEF